MVTKEELEDTVRKIVEAYEEKLNEERKLRAEVEKLNEHLYDQIFDIRRKL